MNSRERVLSAYEFRGYDRIPVKHEATPEVNAMLMRHFGLKNMEQVFRVVGDDFRYVEPDYIGPELRTFPDGSVEGYFGERYTYVQYGNGRYLEATHLPFAGVEELKDLDRSHFPQPEWFDYSRIRERSEAIRQAGFAVCFGSAGDMDFINSIARARGTEQVLIDLADESPVYLAIMQARFDFYHGMHRKALEAAGGRIDFTHIGEDLGTQIAPMISMETFDKFFADKFGQYFRMAHSHGARVMMHMCGCSNAFLPRLLELGLDVYDVVQPTTPEQDLASLQKRFGRRLRYQGSMDVQKELAFGKPADVEREAWRRIDLFPDGGLVLGPSHAIQPGSPLENILALYRAAGSLMERPDAAVLAVGTAEEGVGKINMSKLF